MKVNIFGYSIALTITKNNIDLSQKLLNWLKYYNTAPSKISLIKALRTMSSDGIDPTISLMEAKAEIERLFDFVNGEVIVK